MIENFRYKKQKYKEKITGSYNLYLSNMNLYDIGKDAYLYLYSFIISFNTFEFPIKAEPDDPENFLNDLVFLYSNSIIYIISWILEYYKEKIINDVSSILNNEKQNDISGTRCTPHHSYYSCTCTLTHATGTWDSAKTRITNIINLYFEDIFNDIKKMIELKLYFTFLLCAVYIKYPVILYEKIKTTTAKKIYTSDKILNIILPNNGKEKDIIKIKIKKELKITENAINIQLSRLKNKNYIEEIENKIYLKKNGMERIKYLRG